MKPWMKMNQTMMEYFFDFGRYLIGTEMKGLQIQLNALIDGIGFGGTIPSNMESNLMKRLQFSNCDASPFAGIGLLKGISKEIDTPLLTCFWR